MMFSLFSNNLASLTHIPKSFIKNSVRCAERLAFNIEDLWDPLKGQDKEEILKMRKTNVDMENLRDLYKKIQVTQSELERKEMTNQLYRLARELPNSTSPHVLRMPSDGVVLRKVNKKTEFDFPPAKFDVIVHNARNMKCDPTYSIFASAKSYAFFSTLAELERALIRYAISHLLKRNFLLVSVPDILPASVLEHCGMNTRGHRSQVYHLNSWANDICLSGTAEMAIGGLLKDKHFERDKLPLKLVAVSRCYRKEVNANVKEKHIYRVHQFSKVEMFGVTADDNHSESDAMYNELIEIQEELISNLNLHFQVRDMPINELGRSAYCKTDIEVWLPEMNFYGEVSSASNCTAYQSQRLNITYTDSQYKKRFVHTCNGTACAIPRCIMAIVLNNQQKNGSFIIPEVLRPFMNGKSLSTKFNDPVKFSIKQTSYKGRIS